MWLASLRRAAIRLGAAGLMLSGCQQEDGNGGSGGSDGTDGEQEFCVVPLREIAEGNGGFVIDGERGWGSLGGGVGVGDLNGDGLDDACVSAHDRSGYTGEDFGRWAAVFGKGDTDPVGLEDLVQGDGGYAVGGPEETNEAGGGIRALGDMNGDGIPDFALLDGSVGDTYVVFGKADTEPVLLAEIADGVGGFVIRSDVDAGRTGDVAGTGDINGDGIPDLAIAASFYCYTPGDPECPEIRRSYVVFGKADTEPVLLSEIVAGQGGFVLQGTPTGGHNLAGPGDINGDGLADVAVGDRSADVIGAENAGRTYVVFGKADTEAVSLEEIAQGSGGFVVNGEAKDDGAGIVSEAGDQNGDGVPDLLIYAPWADVAGPYVVFGKADTEPVSLADVAEEQGGFVFLETGETVNAAGDQNADGIPDMVVSMGTAYVSGVGEVGRVFVVFGKADREPVSLADVLLGKGGYVLEGEEDGDHASGASSAGDINGDGVMDLLIGASGFDPNNKDPNDYDSAGRLYVVFGGNVPECATGG